LHKHLNEKPKKILSLFKKSNFKIENVIFKCLEKNPAERFQSYDELWKTMHGIIKKCYSNYKEVTITERFKRNNIGEGEIVRTLNEKGLAKKVGVNDLKYEIIGQSDLNPHLEEGLALMSMGEYEKASKIFECQYFPEFPELLKFHIEAIINYALCLIYINKVDDAIKVFESIKDIEEKPSAYYVNLSLAYIYKRDWSKSEHIAIKGLAEFKDDPDLIGNLVTSFIQQKK